MVSGQAGPCVGNTVAIPRLGFPGLCLHDGPLALRVADYTSTFSAGVSAGASWDKVLVYGLLRLMDRRCRIVSDSP